jgi:hypothetical protein
MTVEMPQISYPGKRWRQKEKEGMVHEPLGSKKSISIENSQQKEKPEELYKKILTNWASATPTWTIGSGSSLEIEKLKNQNMSISDDVSLLQETVNDLQSQILEMQKEIDSLKSQLKIFQESDLWKESDHSADMLERVFNTHNIQIQSSQQALCELRGILKDCRKDGIDSVMMVHSARGD